MIAKSWFSRGWQWKIGGCVVIVGALSVGVSDRVNAQIVPDNTLGAESSVVTPNVIINGIPSDQIDGGAPRGANLFHSFSQFNIGAGRGAYFTPPPEIENILTRVTGANRSEILGRLGVLGNANLFLINPNGIVFGPNASLDVQGSFLATTADAVKLGDAGLFSASQPATSNLLTVSPSALWFNAIAAQPIVNQSQAPSLIGQPNSARLSPGLQVPLGQTLALVGGDVLLEGGNLTTAGGRIELGSVAGVGQVSLSQTGNRFVLGYDSVSGFGNILLSNGAFVDASGEGGGDVQIRGARLEMTQGSNIRADTLGAENGSEILVRATEVELSESSRLSAVVRGIGTGGDLTIETGQLLISDGAVVATVSLDEGAGGNLTVLASERVQVTGTDVNGSPSFLASESQGKGDAGELTIETGQLLISDGAVVSTSARDEGAGGNLTVLASERVQVTGSDVIDGSPSGLGSLSVGKGDAGELTIETGQLLISDGAQVSTTAFDEGAGGNLTVLASERVQVTGSDVIDGSPSALGSQSQGKGDAGEVTIETGQLLISDGAIVTTTAFDEGAGGNLTIVASERVQVTGSDVIDGSPSGLGSQSQGKGDAGEVTIETGQLLISDGAQVTTTAFDEGAGGKLTVLVSDSVLLNNQGLLEAASTGTGNTGNIKITVDGVLSATDSDINTSSLQSAGGAITINAGDIRLFGDSDIRSNVASGANNGGNITLTADFILAFDDSDILAFARDGRGGDVTFDTPAFFGENYRPAPPNTDPDTLENNNQVDINATGAVEGVITITSDTSFIQNSLTELPDNQINIDNLLANSCIVRRNQPTRGSFTITGSGGLPQRPGDAQMSSFPTVDIETLPSDGTPTNTSPNRPWQKGDPIVEPQGVYRLPNGKLVLSRECP
jgi:filamentous hemagglutinin family protein